MTAPHVETLEQLATDLSIASMNYGETLRFGTADDIRRALKEMGNARQRMSAAIALMRGQSWQDIASAPKDGTSVLLFLPGKEASWPDSQCTAYWHEQHDRWCLLETGAHAIDGDVWPQPTHWQPLPTPPKDPADEQ